MKIAVTGSTGFLGMHVLYELATRGLPIRALYHSKEKLDRVRKVFGYYCSDPEALMKNIEWVQGDLLDSFFLTDALKNITHVYHAAGMVSFNERDKRRLMEINAGGTSSLVNACQEEGVQKLCHVSSIASLGEAQPGEPITENMIWNPASSASSYSISKFKGEMEVWRGIHEGLNAVIVNPSVIVGPGMWFTQSASLLKQVYAGLTYYPAGSGGYVDVRDVARAMIMLTESDASGDRFTINAQNLTHREVLNYMAAAMNKPLPTRQLTPFIIKLACTYERIRALMTGTAPRITSKSMEIAASNTAYSNQKILLYPIQFTPIRDSIQLAVGLYLREINSK
jgi:nucleoside-diphosphate-sugar epimerase